MGGPAQRNSVLGDAISPIEAGVAPYRMPQTNSPAHRKDGGLLKAKFRKMETLYRRYHRAVPPFGSSDGCSADGTNKAHQSRLLPLTPANPHAVRAPVPRHQRRLIFAVFEALSASP